jgi:hypothetical protein
MKNSIVLLWWFLYMLVGAVAGFGGSFVAGIVLGMIGVPELVAMVIILPLMIYINFVVFRWSVGKIIADS